MIFGLWFSLKVHGLQIGAPLLYSKKGLSYSKGNSYFSHRWGILLFTPPPGSRARRLGWSQYMHECVGASQGYHEVVGGLGLGLAVGWLVGSWRWGLPHRCGDSAVPVAAPRQDRLGCTIDPMIATRQHTHACTVTNRVFRREIQVVG